MLERRILRYWPWLVMCTVAGLVFGGLCWLALAAALRTQSSFLLVVDGLIGLGMLALAGYSLASLRVRTRLDAEAATAIWPFSRRRLTWRGIDRLDVAHLLPGWTVRGWSQDEPFVIFVCHDTHGRRPTAETYETPPPDTPKALREGYVQIERYWQSARP